MALFSAMQDKNGKKNEPVPKSKPQVAPEIKKQGVTLYEGGIEKTPTGKSNAFVNNVDKMTADDFIKNAKKLGLRTDSNENLQEDLYNLLAEKHPEKLKEIMSTFGETKAGSRIYKGQKVPISDKYVGARSLIAMKKLGDDKKIEDDDKDFKYSDKPRGESLYDKSGALVGNFEYKVKNADKTPDETFSFSGGKGTSGKTGISGKFKVPNEQIMRFRNLVQIGASKFPDNPSSMSLEELEKYRVKE